MRKRDRVRAKRDQIWAKMDERKAQRKAEGGLCMLIAMVFVMGTMHMCTPDLADAKRSNIISSSRSSSKSYSKPAPKRVYKAPVKKAVVKNINPEYLLLKGEH